MRKSSRLPIPVVLMLGLAIAAVHLVAIAALAHSIINGRMARWEDRKNALDPHELWSVEALPVQADWPPVKLCTDTRARAGFLVPMPTVAGRPCVPEDRPLRRGNVSTMRCSIDGTQFVASASFEGDTKAEFTATYRITRLGGDPRRPARFQETRRYRRLGACPDGWSVGDHTDRTGRRVTGAMREVSAAGRRSPQA